MPNPFGKNGGPVASVPRNTFDLSFQNNLTTQFGRLTPVFCKEVIPGDSFKIDTTFGLRFMPTAFPLQTRMRADIHFFYVRNRNLWKDWPDFFGKTKDNLVFPYIPGDGKSVSLKTGSLADMLGIPTTLVGDYGTEFTPIDARSPFRLDPSIPFTPLYELSQSDNLSAIAISELETPVISQGKFMAYFHRIYCPRAGDYIVKIPFHESIKVGPLTSYLSSVFIGVGLSSSASTPPDAFSVFGENVDGTPPKDSILYALDNEGIFNSVEISYEDDYIVYKFELNEAVLGPGSAVLIGLGFSGVAPDRLSFLENFPLTFDEADNSNAVDFIDYVDRGGVFNPFDVSQSNTQALSALPFRAYESIYNAFYRDERNNPFILDGQKEYNKYLPTNEGGKDSTSYDYHYRNWEQDFLTTAVPTPQQGQAPLVGISALGVMTFQDSETGKTYSVQATTADDADTITGFQMTDGLPGSVARQLVNYASSGISINDFRNVNAFQRWLETNIRRGFKYRDMIKSHFDVDVSYQELDMPEFIGGVSCDIMPTTVTQTSEDSQENPLGSYAGQLYGTGSSKHSVQNYCDEHGFIIGIMSVVPVPNYSQLLPKFFTKITDSLDYFSPEFGHIGLQAIPYSEVCPVQAANGGDKLSSTFGYQRAFYDYMQSVDEVHGQFRTTLRNFVMNRTFNNKPVLGPSFTLIDPKQLNEVFTVQSVNGEVIDKILGQLYFDVKVKRPIPKYGIPRLE